MKKRKNINHKKRKNKPDIGVEKVTIMLYYVK